MTFKNNKKANKNNTIAAQFENELFNYSVSDEKVLKLRHKSSNNFARLGLLLSATSIAAVREAPVSLYRHNIITGQYERISHVSVKTAPIVDEIEYYKPTMIRPEQMYIRNQEALYSRMKSQLLNDYEGMYIAFEDGHVLDMDAELVSLMRRVYRQRSGQPTLVKQVLREEPVLHLNWRL